MSIDRLTPAERIDLKADMERVKELDLAGSDPLGDPRRLSSSDLHEDVRRTVDAALWRYPVLVELVRRLSEEKEIGNENL